MADTSHRHWLRDELPGLVRAEVLDTPAAERLRAHYQLDALAAPINRTMVALAVLGGGLIGAGVILLVANNWDELGRPARAGVCLALLLFAQGLAGFALGRRPTSDAWREGTALFVVASLGAALSLISQTYHAVGELGDLVLGWSVLAIPVAYLLEARVAAIALCALALFLPLGRDHAVDEGYLFFAVLAALGPMVYSSVRGAPGDRRTAALCLAFAASAALGAAMLVGRDAPAAMGVVLVGGLVLVHVLPSTTGGLGRPLRALAATALVIAGLVLSFDWAWGSMYDSYRGWGTAETVATLAAAALAGFALTRFFLGDRRGEDAPVMFILLAMWLGFGMGFLDARPSVIAALLMNLALLGFGTAQLVAGLRELEREPTNFGLGVLSLLFLVRFFDTDVSFVVRGLGMIAVGVAFLAVNVYLSRRTPEASR